MRSESGLSVTSIMKGSDDEIEVIPSQVGKKRSRAQKVEFPSDGILNIVVHIITVNPQLQYVKSQKSIAYLVEYASSILDNVDDEDPNLNVESPTIVAPKLHKIVVNFFARRALATVDRIVQSRGLG